jgi:hypothetical protein
LGEISRFLWAVFFNLPEFFGYFLPKVRVMHFNFDKKIGWTAFGVIFFLRLIQLQTVL